MKIEQSHFGKINNRMNIDRFTIINQNNVTVSVMTYGGILMSVKTPDNDGRVEEVTLGFDHLNAYLGDHPYFGAIIGRFANRIARGRFALEDKTFSLFCNDGENHLHGGEKGFDRKVWKAVCFEHHDAAGVRLTTLSPDNEEGYPGNLSAAVTYTLTASDEIIVEYEASVDKPTPVNLTIHPYWNLAGPGSGSIESHDLTLFSDQYLEVNDNLIPTGTINDVRGTPFDFTAPKQIGDEIDGIGGYDHCFVIRQREDELSPAAELFDPVSRRSLKIFTTQPGLQFYTGNFLDGIEGREGEIYAKFGGLCLETQGFPDAVNHTHFPSCILRPGEKYHEAAKYELGVK